MQDKARYFPTRAARAAVSVGTTERETAIIEASARLLPLRTPPPVRPTVEEQPVQPPLP